MKYYYIYAHICLITGKPYIGWSVDPKRRWKQHCVAKDNTAFHNAIRKYGKECFEFQIIFRTVNLEEVKRKEIEFIKQFDSLAPNGYNLSKGGDGGPELLGINHPMYGRKHTKESKEKIRASIQGTHLTKETKKKQSKAKQGKNNPMFGKENPNAHTIESEIKRLKTRIKKLEEKDV